MAEKGPTRSRANTRERLIDAAFDVFAREGFSGASIEMITDAAGFTRGAFYSNFSSKEELFLALADREVRERTRNAADVLNGLNTKPFCQGGIDVGIVGSILNDIVSRSSTDREWHIMMAEFELFALRNPDRATTYLNMRERFLERVVEELLPPLEEIGVKFAGDETIAARLIINAYLEATRQAFLTPNMGFQEALSSQMEWFSDLASRLVKVDEYSDVLENE